MKRTATVYSHSSHYCPAYPNEADTNYYKKRLIDIIGGLMCGAGLTMSLVFLVMIT